MNVTCGNVGCYIIENMLKKLKVENYKAFKEPVEIELRPLTVFIGKNSSGKSSICKLLKSLSNSVSMKGFYPIPLSMGGVVLGSNFEDLFHNRETSGLNIALQYDENLGLSVSLLMMNGSLLYSGFSTHVSSHVTHLIFRDAASASLGSIYTVLSNEPWKSKFPDLKDDLSFDVDYIGPIRAESKRTIERIAVDETLFVGYKGDKTYEILLNSYLTDGVLFKRVSDWFSENMDGQKLEIREQGPGSGLYSLYVRRNDSHSICIADVGEGINQLLPIVVQAFVEKENRTITVIEQPSLHLHPAAHAKVAYCLADAVKQTGKQFVVETHSENFLLGLRYQIAKGFLDINDVVIYSLDHDGNNTVVSKIEIDENFEYTDWPEGVFEEDFELLNMINRERK